MDQNELYSLLEHYHRFFSGAGGEVDYCWLALRFFGDDLDPAIITEKLNLTPTVCFRRGDIDERRNKAYKTGVWLLETPRSLESPAELVAQTFNQSLNACINEIRELASYYKADLKLNMHIDRWCRGTTFPASILDLIAATGLELSLEVYAARPEAK